MIPILVAFGVLALVGIVLGLMLAVASKAFHVEADPRIDQIKECLPGANCGGCGYAGCGGYAEAVAKGEAPVNACNAAGKEGADKIAAIMGVATADVTKMYARVSCSGAHGKAKPKYQYEGLEDCRAAIRVGGGDKICPNGCVGHGTCVSVCRFDAIHVIDGVAVVDKEKCAGCGVCVAACPKGIIELVPFEANYFVGCKSYDKGTVTRSYCTVGCIGCKICEKNCPTSAIRVENGLASIDYSLCTGCGVCYEKCPRHSIIKAKKDDAPAESEETAAV